ncbi:MacB family efflux pump subunit [Morganella psychrotolerans]|uniref:Pyoverdine export ATP-binding/permease protein PvdT n=1 Tax=Morganella psychrotolerans TaxID=368603 RepID=A0A1B8H598_9GAMM|nr:MacB family efflux pump subunit [Morganella psychrotolerans]OBU04258.1 macrolide ABC transporter permease/ATP-binding protein MacB [Morganella psychrotolerans]
MSALIELNSVSRRYTNGGQTLTVLDNISLTISAGEFVAITGSSGSGKSTLMNILGCLDTPDSGDYRLGGRNTARLSPDELASLRREHIGFIFQRYHLMNDLTAAANTEIPAIYAGSNRSERRARATELLARLGLTGREHHKPGELSGGQQQRVCIARALMNGGEIILADEPTGALDSASGREVLATLTELNLLGHTIVMVTHDPLVAQHARRIIELRDGRISADNGPDTTSHTPFTPRVAPRSSLPRRMADSIRESFMMALKSMNAHRQRTVLTMTGIIFGISAVVTVVAIGEGAKQKTLENIRDLGSNIVSVYAGTDHTKANDSYLLLSDIPKLAALPGVGSISPEVTTDNNMTFRGRSVPVSITGVSREYFQIWNYPVLQGGVFPDGSQASQDIVLDENAVNTLFIPEGISPVGQVVFLGSVPARVIGVVKNTRDYGYSDVNVWLPYNTVMQRMTGKSTISTVVIRVRDDANTDATAENIRQTLILQHGKEDFRIFNLDKYRRSYEKSAMILSLLILSVASVALMIGSLGVMNIMLVSVTERTHEIGVRMAVGARRRDIMQQFMIEAVLMCLIGGVLGIALSLIISGIFSGTGTELTAIYSWQAAAVAFLCSTIIGMIFGWLPARKAAAMDPVTALAGE